jgi:hypothetical protein
MIISASPDDDERTNPVGLFNYARSYWQAALIIDLPRLRKIVTHADAPVTYLFCHAIELYLKAYLRHSGLSVAEVRKIGHAYDRLASRAKDLGLALGQDDFKMIELLTDQEMMPLSRYIRTGFYKRPTDAALSGVCQRMDDAISQVLRLRRLIVE